MTTLCRTILIFPAFLLTMPAGAGVFIFAENQGNPDLITHPSGYTGTGGPLTISVCIDPDSESITDMEVPVQNVIAVWNKLEPVLGNLTLNNPELGFAQYDYESVLLHELGHCIGLGHPNLASESGLSGSDRRYAKALEGSNNAYDLNTGSDGVIGTRTDLRGDDINLGWYRVGVNDPWSYEAIIDGNTHSSDPGQLPGGHQFVEIAGLQVAQLRGHPNDEAVMHQGTRNQETRRLLSRDDATMIRIGMSGLDRTQGTADDYNLSLQYGGVSSGCDITVTIQGGSFGFCSVGLMSIPGHPDHWRITSGTVTMGSASVYNWYFNQELRGGIFSDRFEAP